jgi:transposase
MARQIQRRRIPVRSTSAVPIHKSMAMRFSHQVEGLKGEALLRRFKGFSKAVIYKHAKKALDGGELVVDRRIGSGKGRPSKLSNLDRRNVGKAVEQLRAEQGGSFNSLRVGLEAGLGQKCHNRTVRRAMNKLGFQWLNARRKGQLSKEDQKIRLSWARSKVKENVTQAFWNYGVSMYMDGVGFTFKENAFDQARAPKGRLWRRTSEGLARNCTAKLNKAGTKEVKFMVAISFQRGVVLCESYTEHTGILFSKMCDACLPQAFNLSINPYDRRYLQDGCPVQNSKVAKQILEDLGAEMVAIPPRSPDLNPIENFFHLVGRALAKDSIEKNVTSQTIEEFEERLRGIIVNFDSDLINRCIGSMDRRVREVIKRRGGRTKY